MHETKRTCKYCQNHEQTNTLMGTWTCASTHAPTQIPKSASFYQPNENAHRTEQLPENSCHQGKIKSLQTNDKICQVHEPKNLK